MAGGFGSVGGDALAHNGHSGDGGLRQTVQGQSGEEGENMGLDGDDIAPLRSFPPYRYDSFCFIMFDIRFHSRVLLIFFFFC